MTGEKVNKEEEDDEEEREKVEGESNQYNGKKKKMVPS